MLKLDGWHTAEQIAPQTYRIDEGQLANCYLLLGDARALLIDTGNGMGRIRDAVSLLTKLPVDVVLTHRHCDHAGGAGFFDRCFVHPGDLAPVYGMASSAIAARMLAARIAAGSDFPKRPHAPRYAPIQEGHAFVLGYRRVWVLHTPGHSRGSVVLLDERERLMFTGDNVAPTLWLWLPGAVPVETWLAGARRILSLCGRYTPYYGHGDGRQNAHQIQTLVALGEALLEKTVHNAPFGRTRAFPANRGETFLLYNTARVLAKQSGAAGATSGRRG